MLLAALLATTAAAGADSPPNDDAVVVLVSRRVELTSSTGLELAEAVVEALRGAGLPVPLSAEEAAKRLSVLGVADSAACDGQRRCMAGHGALLGAKVVVAVELGRLGEDLAVHLEALTAAGDSRLGARDVVVPLAEGKVGLAGEALLLSPALKPLFVPKPDVPRVVELTPPPREPAPVVVSPRGWAEPKVLVTGGAALAAGAVAAVFAVRGASARSDYESSIDRSSGSPVFDISRTRAESLRGTANQSFTVAAVAAGTGVVLAAAAGYLYATATE